VYTSRLRAVIRLARRDDIAAMQAVERAAGEQFRDVGMGDIADHDPMPASALAEYVDDGRAWCAELDGAVVGYAVAETVDGHGHLEQISVHPDVQGRGLGRALVDAVAAWADGAVTLTTFRDVPWNRPLYEHLGFVVVHDDEIGPELAHKVIEEIQYGLDPALRVSMRLG
jgi:GNAT superfamily N-acetyltransferase